MHHYQFNIGDYRRDTVHLSLLEHGIYRMIIDSYYANEGPLKADDSTLMRMHCIRTADEEAAYRNVIADFFSERDGYYHHDGCDKVLGKIFAKSESARKSAEARWANKNKGSKRTQCERNANGMRESCESDATHNPEPITHNPIESGPDGPRSPPTPTDEDIKMAEAMFNLIRVVAPKAKDPNFEKWGNDIRLMREQDGHTHLEIWRVFKFANTDRFWKTNILSTSKLRERFPSLHSQMINGDGNGKHRTGSDTYQSRSDRADQAVRDHLSKH